MRLVPFAVAVLMSGAAVVATVPAQAQDSPTRIIIQKMPPKSFLDPGTVVKPGGSGSRHLNYVDVVHSRYPQYGQQGGITGDRWPLPSQFELPRY